MIKITDHILVDEQGKVSFHETPNVSGPFKTGYPDTIVIHYTAGASLQSSVSWLRNPAAKASAHLVIGKSGEVVQLSPFNIRTWHAGASSWKGRTSLNQYSIGIELDNAGMLVQTPDGYTTNFNKKMNPADVVLARHKSGGDIRPWERFTMEQLEMLTQICRVLTVNYGIREIVGHDAIAPGRKFDPGPAFPMIKLQNDVFFPRNEDGEAVDGQELELALVVADNLNIRKQPGLSAPKVSNPLPLGTKVKILETQGDWSLVKTEIEGWVYNPYLKKV